MVTSAGAGVEPIETFPTHPGLPVPKAADPTLLEALGTMLWSRSVLYMVLAVLAMSLAALLPLGRIVRWGPVARGSQRAAPALALLALGTLALLAVVAMVYVPGLGREAKGAHRWVAPPIPGLGGFSFQPSELAKWGLVVVLAIYGAMQARHMRQFFRGLIPGLIAIALVAGLVAKEDLGTGVLIAAAACVVLLAAGARFWPFPLFVPPAAAAFLALVLVSPYRLTRIETFLDPYADPRGAGFHMIQSMAAVAGGEGWGRGLGDGLQKFGYLPEDTTDFLFAIICEELGIAGAATVIALYVALIWACLAIVRKQDALVLKLIGVGVLTTVGLQALINLAVVTGLGPTKGIALPLVSSGGTGWILTAFCLGLLVAMDRDAERQRAVLAPRAAGRRP
ncbi:FtsW/RodA/SpoVE family cell cycle protein [Leptolyngbya sp. 15MV]|nr:FtsW/RodA/SpoVE family cell cycle protein [Leptolyngbya sp. 15MV]